MTWLIPIALVLASVLFWCLSFRTDDVVAAWCRCLLAGFLFLLESIYAVVLTVQALA